MTQLLFNFQEFAAEIDAFNGLAAPFIANQSRLVLPGLRGTLETYRDQGTEQPTDWAIAENNPLITEISRGKYEVGGGGGHAIYGAITAKWRIQRVPPKKKAQRAEHFRLIGIASTRVRLISQPEDAEPFEVAMWRMEVGDAAGPGCHFHVQVLGETAACPFPNSVPVPRLPGLLLTPAAVIEFVLGELFQDDWLKHVAQDSVHLQRWAPIQKRRFVSLLQWHIETLGRGGSPWSVLKSTKPNENLFVGAVRA